MTSTNVRVLKTFPPNLKLEPCISIWYVKNIKTVYELMYKNFAAKPRRFVFSVTEL